MKPVVALILFTLWAASEVGAPIAADAGESSCVLPLTLYCTDGFAGNLHVINQATAESTLIGHMGLGSGGSPALAVDPTTGVLYAGSGGGQDRLYTVNPATAASTLVGNTGLGAWGIVGLDIDAGGTLYAALNLAGPGHTGGETLGILDKSTGAGTVIGGFGVSDMGGIAFDSTGILFGASGGGAGPPTLYTINRVTGSATVVGPIVDVLGSPPAAGFTSLEFSLDGVLYGGLGNGYLIRIDPSTGVFGPTGVGPTTSTRVGGLAIAGDCYPCAPPATLYCTDGFAGNLHAINQATAESTLIGNMGLGPGGSPALAVDPTTGALYAGSGGGQDRLYTVDPVTAASTLVGQTGLGAWGIVGLDIDASGTIFAALNLSGPGSTGGETLGLLDKFTGAGTVIGTFGVTDVGGIAFDSAGVLYGASGGGAGPPTLYTIHPGTGLATAVGPIVDIFGSPPAAGFTSVEFGLDGILYGGLGNGDLIRIDSATGVFGTVGLGPTTSTRVGGLAVAGAPDDDADGYCAGFDCDESNAAAWTPGAPEINDGLDNTCPGEPGYGTIDELGQSIAEDGKLIWPPQAGATQYQTVRSTDPGFASGCVFFLNGQPEIDDTATPSQGTVFYYLSCPLLPHTGSWGMDSSGTERTVLCSG